MTEEPIAGITVDDDAGHVVVEIAGGRWEGTPVEAERLITRLFYVLERARPGSNIVSVFHDGQLWGGKTLESDPDRARARVIELLAGIEDRLTADGRKSPPT